MSRWAERAARPMAGTEERECMYGDGPLNAGNCTIVVAPGMGWRDGSLVFCSEEHAALDQQESF